MHLCLRVPVLMSAWQESLPAARGNSTRRTAFSGSHCSLPAAYFFEREPKAGAGRETRFAPCVSLPVEYTSQTFDVSCHVLQLLGQVGVAACCLCLSIWQVLKGIEMSPLRLSSLSGDNSQPTCILLYGYTPIRRCYALTERCRRMGHVSRGTRGHFEKGA